MLYDIGMSHITDEIMRLQKKVEEGNIPTDLEARLTANIEEIKRLENDISARIHIEQMLKYIDWAASLPWSERTEDILDPEKASFILDKNHYGIRIVKERILEYLAVLKLLKERGKENKKINEREDKLSHAILARRAPILCLVGLVGTGKTTLAKSIAEAMGRRFIRIPFGGMSDALDLRGQSRVRPDAEIGLVLKGLRYAGAKNLVMLFDEIDRVATNARGDIMGVLIELLDPEQNSHFTDHYLDYPFDLSEVMFIVTANNTTDISPAVIDRFEPIQMPSYTDEEKIAIARDYIFPELRRESGLNPENLSFDDLVWPKIVRTLGYDAGVRSLERTINSICRKVARMIVEGKSRNVRISLDNLKEFIDIY